MVHKHDCVNIKGSNRLIDVEWNYGATGTYLTDLSITVIKGKNQLLDIITKASQKDIYIESVQTFEELDYIKFAITVKTSNAQQLEAFIADVKSLSFVVEVGRSRN